MLAFFLNHLYNKFDVFFSIRFRHEPNAIVNCSKGNIGSESLKEQFFSWKCLLPSLYLLIERR